MSEDKICPLIELSSDKERIDIPICLKEKCAWYDDKNNQCILITIGRGK